MNSNMSICICVLLSLCTDKTHVLELTLAVLCTIYMNTYVQVGMYKCVSLAWCVLFAPYLSPPLFYSIYPSPTSLSTVSARILWRSLFSPVYIDIFLLEQFLRKLDKAIIIFRSHEQTSVESAHTHTTRVLSRSTVYL